MPNQLYFGDNLDVLRRHIPDSSVDLIYLDPPFNSKASYNILFREQSGDDSPAQITAFDDAWHWDMLAEATFREVVGAGGPVGSLLEALRRFLGSNDMMAYLTMMAARLKELHRVLKQTGSIYLHCDPTASHYLKLLMDAVFGPLNFANHITWKRADAHNDAKRQFGWLSDHILLYRRSAGATFSVQYQPFPEKTLRDWYLWLELPDGTTRRMTTKERETQVIPEGARRFNTDNIRSPHPRPNLTYDYKGYKPHPNGWCISYEVMRQLDEQGLLLFPSNKNGRIMRKKYLDQQAGVIAGDVWTDISQIRASYAERLGYPTQKPEALLERIIRASSNEGDLVLDPFCGCGTTVAVAERLHRRWIGIDVTHLAIALMRKRLHDTFGDQLAPYEVHGEPTDLPSAQALARQDRYQFQYWALGLADARPVGDVQKKGADGGVDGEIIFFDDDSGQARRVVLSVKSGHVNVAMLRDLRSLLDHDRAQIGAFLTLEEPSAPMRIEAAEAGFYQPPGLQEPVPRLQLLTIEELLEGRRLLYPHYSTGTFARAPRQHKRPRRG